MVDFELLIEDVLEKKDRYFRGKIGRTRFVVDKRIVPEFVRIALLGFSVALMGQTAQTFIDNNPEVLPKIEAKVEELANRAGEVLPSKQYVRDTIKQVISQTTNEP